MQWSTARALLAEPSLGPVQALEVYDALVAKIEAVLEHRRMLVETRTLVLHSRRRTSSPSSPPRSVTSSVRTARSRPAWPGSANLDVDACRGVDAGRRLPAVVADWLPSTRTARRCAEIRRLERDLVRLLDEHGTTLREEPGIGPIAAATLVVEVGDPFRFASESKFARWCGTGAVALSSGEGAGIPVRHRLDFGGNRRINSVLYIASITTPPSPRTVLRHSQMGLTRFDGQLDYAASAALSWWILRDSYSAGVR